MKNLKFIALALVFSISTMSFAIVMNKNPNKELRKKIVELLGETIENWLTIKL